MGETVDLLPSIAIMPCEDEEYAYVSVTALERTGRGANGEVLSIWKETFYVKENVASVSLEDSRTVLARILNTIAERLYPDDWAGSEVVPDGTRLPIRV